MPDSTETVGALRQAVRAFVEERQWRPFHDPKNLSMAIATEAAELMEHFRWLTNQQARELPGSLEDKRQVSEELADIMCFALSFADSMDIDISTAVREKLVKNAIKYPVERYRGRFK